MQKKKYCGMMYESPTQKRPTFEAKGIETVSNSCVHVEKYFLQLQHHLPSFLSIAGPARPMHCYSEGAKERPHTCLPARHWPGKGLSSETVGTNTLWKAASFGLCFNGESPEPI